jgi:hypothetical protein
MEDGGFDVILGNPPYVEFSRSKVKYQVRGFTTMTCDNLWSYIVERSVYLLKSRGRMSLITPLSLVSTSRFAPVFRLLSSTTQHATFLTLAGDAHPSVLFSGVKMSYTIFTYEKNYHGTSDIEIYMSKLYRWLAIERDNLFALVEYNLALPQSALEIPFKVGSEAAADVIKKILAHSRTISYFEKKTGVPLLYHRIVRHFVKSLFRAPYFRNERDGEKKSDDYKMILFEDKRTAQLVRTFLVSSTYYIFFVALSDAYHCGRELVLSFPVGRLIPELPA